MTYSEIKTKLDTLAADISRQGKAIADARAALGVSVATLAGFVATYTPLIEAIGEYVAANPNEELAKVLNQEQARLVAEFLALQQVATAAVAAIPA